MAVTPPTTEPSRLVANTTWTWRRDDLGYAGFNAGDGWALSYTISNATNHFSFSATADAQGFLISVPAATTSTFTAGLYTCVAFIANGIDRRELFRFAFQIDPDPAAGNVDMRSHARKVLASIEAVIEGRASLDQQSYQLDGRRLDRTPIPDLLLLADRYRQSVRNEEESDRARKGQGSHRRVLTRFGAPSTQTRWPGFVGPGY